MSTPASNVLQLTGNGLNISYDFGPNVATLANSAYSFMNGTSAAADAFEGNSIAGTQSFLSDAVSPIINAVAGESNDYYSQILGAFGQTNAIQSQTANAGINAEQAVSQASIKSSTKSAGGGSIFSSIFGGCFITTAVCKYSGLPDDCDTLQTMRAWRNTWMSATPERIAMVCDYYATAPRYVARISAYHESRQEIIWAELRRLILTACHHIKRGSHELALAYYLAAVEFARVSAGGVS